MAAVARLIPFDGAEHLAGRAVRRRRRRGRAGPPGRARRRPARRAGRGVRRAGASTSPPCRIVRTGLAGADPRHPAAAGRARPGGRPCHRRPQARAGRCARGTVLRGGKDAFGNERRYATLDSLTASARPWSGCAAWSPGATEPACPGIAARRRGSRSTPRRARTPPHRLRVCSAGTGLRRRGDLTAADLRRRHRRAAYWRAMVWRYSTPRRGDERATAGTVVGEHAHGWTVPHRRVRAAPDGGTRGSNAWSRHTCRCRRHCRSRASRRGHRADARVPQTAYYNDGAVDITKEFQPFGAVAKRGDAFYLRWDEAFGKRCRSRDRLGLS